MSTKRPARKSKKADAKSAAAAAAPARPWVAHHLVPPHELLSETEGAQVLANLKTLAERLPRILPTDPGLQTDPAAVKAREERQSIEGRLVRVRRPSATAGEAIAYRLVGRVGGD